MTATFASSAETGRVVCVQCGEENPLEETFCHSCGTALDDEDTAEHALTSLAVGETVAGRWVIEAVDSYGEENRYRACALPTSRTQRHEPEDPSESNGRDTPSDPNEQQGVQDTPAAAGGLVENVDDHADQQSLAQQPSLDPPLQQETVETAETGRDEDAAVRVILRERAVTNAEPLHALATRTAVLSHPALVVPEPCAEHNGRVYLPIPEVAGIRLVERIGLTSEREVVGWGIQLCQILGFLHRQHWLCVELPPDTVVLDKTGRIRLTQFETLSEKGSQHDPLFLSDGYAAPELYKPGELAETADVFAIGALLYSLVVGRRLPVESWVVQPEPPLFYPEKVLSPDLERVLRTALQLHAHDRYQTVAELKTALLKLGTDTWVRSAWRTDVGQVREHNEDALLVKERGQGTLDGNTFAGLYIVADGMGGAEAGEIASAIAIRVVAQHVEQAWADGQERDEAGWESCLQDAVAASNAAMLAYTQEHPEATGMGSTIVAGLLQDSTLSLAWVGDSRIYVLENGQLLQLSRDHSLVERLVEIGQLTPEEARVHEHRNVLIRSLGSKEQVAVDTLTRSFQRGNRLLLCSDGLTSHVEDPAIADILSRHREPGEAALELVVAANTGGGSDNVSVIVVFNE